MRKTKIICTVGPSTDKSGVLRKMVESGMDAVRFNFSHGTYEEHQERYRNICKLRSELKKPIAVILDTKGPEIRLGKFINQKEYLKKGQRFILTTRDVNGTNEMVSISYKNFSLDIKEGASVLIDDGLIEMIVEEKNQTDIVCRVVNEGEVSDKKGVNVPGTRLSMPYLSQIDREDIEFGIKLGFDFVAASFVRTAQDVLDVRRVLIENNCDNIKIIAKIENKEGVDHIDEIIEVADGIMIARGDMGVEIPGEDVPVIQKMIIKKVYHAGKQVITATQMLDSMMKNPRPTRAEISDVANAIYDGSGVIMLSGETAAGKYPVEAFQMMSRIAEKIESDIDYKKRFISFEVKEGTTICEAISRATVLTAYDLQATNIISVTISGSTARRVSKYRPDCPILGCTTQEYVYRQMNLVWGVVPLKLDMETEPFELFEHAIAKAKQNGYLKEGDITVINAGVPLGVKGITNMIKVQRVGDSIK